MRLDQKVQQDFSLTRSQAQDVIKRGFVSVNGTIIFKPSFQSKDQDLIKLHKEMIFVGRGGDKLLPFIQLINLDLKGKIALDIGASTGGFTQVLLLQGAAHVFAIDVGNNQLDQKLKEDEKVTSLENTNALDLDIPPHDVCVIDVSFTSVIPILKHVYPKAKDVIALIKPQFEQDNDFQTVIKNDTRRLQILTKTLDQITLIGYQIIHQASSSLKGKKGNQEYFVYLKK